MLSAISDFFHLSLFEISILDVLIIIGCVILSHFVDRLIQWILKRLNEKRLKTQNLSKLRLTLVTSLNRPLHTLCITCGAGLGLIIIDTPSWGTDIFHYIFILMRGITIWCVIWYLLLVCQKITEHFAERASHSESKIDDMLVPIVSGLAKFVIVAIGVLLVIQNLGYSISSLLAGLGIGGAALALAAKDTLANFFGSLVVFFDLPFDIGDWVSLNGVEGSIEEIRIRTTLIRTVENSLIMMPNQLLTNTYIDNYQRRTCRKMDCNFGVLYSTTADQIEKIVADIKKHLQDHPELYAPTYYVGFSGFGDSSLDITVTAYTRSTAKDQHFADRQAFMLEIMRIVQNAGTGFAFPTRTLDIPNAAPCGPFRVVMENRK